MIVEGVKDATGKFFQANYEDDKKLQKEKFDDYFKNHFKKWATNLEKLLGEWGPEYFVGNRLTLADMYVYYTYSTILVHTSNCLDEFPKLKALVSKVGSRPKIADWVQRRPQTPW